MQKKILRISIMVLGVLLLLVFGKRADGRAEDSDTAGQQELAGAAEQRRQGLTGITWQERERDQWERVYGPGVGSHDRVYFYSDDEDVRGTDDGAEAAFVMEFPKMELAPIPELGWNHSIHVQGGTYACWGDMLIVNDVVYRREGEVYRRTGQKAPELFRVSVDYYYGKAVQSENLLILLRDWRIQDENSREFQIYDMESQEMTRYPCEDCNLWYIWDEEIYYTRMEERRNALFRMDPRTGRSEEICTWDDGQTVLQFAIRDDGAIMAEVADGRGLGYWLVSPGRDGRYLGKRIWESDEYEFTTFLGFNGRGLLLQGEYWLGAGSALVCLRDSGRAEILGEKVNPGGGAMIAEEGYFRWDTASLPWWEKEKLLCDLSQPEAYSVVDSVAYYDYQGEKQAVCGLIDDRWLEAGYRLEDMIYHGDEIFAFYACEDKDELYVSRVSLKQYDNGETSAWRQVSRDRLGIRDFTRENEEVFYKAAERLGLSEKESAECLRILYEDDVFQGGEGQLTAFLAGDFDGNGQGDMAAMVHQYPYGLYGSGCVYIYMNEDEPYCFVDDEFPFYSSELNGMHISGGDLDHDGAVELLIEASGTGNGGAGDWQGRILKYKDHSLEKTTMLPENEFDIEIWVIQEAEENSYRAFFPERNEAIAFQANEVFPGTGKPRWVGSNVRGLYDMHCVEYQGGYAVEGRECLCGEGGNAHAVADAGFILVWDGGDWKVARWWVETFVPAEDGNGARNVVQWTIP